MAKLTQTASEYADFTVLFLLDKLMNMNEVVGPEYNEDFNVLMEIINKKGIRPYLMRYYISMGSGKRIQYKRVKGVFRTDKRSANTVLDIQQDVKKKEDKKGLLARIKDRVIKTLSGQD